MSTLVEWGGLQKVEYLNIVNVIAFNDDVPNSLTVTRLTIAGGHDWIEIPFIPETASYTMTLGESFNGRNRIHTVALEHAGDFDQHQELSARLESGWYLVRITTNTANKYVVGLKEMPGKFTIGSLTTGTSPLNNVENSIVFNANTNKRALKLL